MDTSNPTTALDQNADRNQFLHDHVTIISVKMPPRRYDDDETDLEEGVPS